MYVGKGVSRLFISVLILLLFLCSAAMAEQAAISADASSVPEGYELVAENSSWKLFLCRDNLGLVMEDVKTGNRMFSTVQNADKMKDNDLWKGFYQSGIVLEYIEGNIAKYPWANLITTPYKKTITLLPDGFTADVHYTELGISYQVTVTLNDNGLSVSIPQSGIREEKPEQYTVGSFYVYPFMGYSYLGEDGGYMIIPDGQGALIDLKDNEGRFTMPFTGTVYGRNIGLQDTASGQMQYSLYGFPTSNDTERVMMPIFGMVHDNKKMGFLGVIEKGDVSASIQAYPNGVQRMMFDWICAKYTYRVVYPQQTGPNSGTINMRTEHAKSFDILQHFLFTSGEEANYTGLAKAYRAYLTDNGTFEHADELREFDVQVDFLGGERKNAVFGKQPVSMTTAEQAQAILTALQEDGVSNILSVYKGWQDKGIMGGLPTSGYQPAGNLGGSQEFEKLFRFSKDKGIRLYLLADLLALNPAENPAFTYDALKKVNNSTYSMYLYAMVYNELQFLTPSKSLEFGQKLIQEAEDAFVPGLSLAGTTEVMTDYYYNQKYFDSSVCADYYSRLASAAAQAMPTVLDSANAYLWHNANALVGLPIGGSDYLYVSREIPFLSIALSGSIPYYAEYVNFQANTQRFFLKLIEQGARPSFYITWEDPIALQETNSYDIYSSQFEKYQDMITGWYKELKALHELIGSSAIDTHIREGDMVRVTYDNGLAIYINFGEKPAALDGVTLERLSYKVVTGHGK